MDSIPDALSFFVQLSDYHRRKPEYVNRQKTSRRSLFDERCRDAGVLTRFAGSKCKPSTGERWVDPLNPPASPEEW